MRVSPPVPAEVKRPSEVLTKYSTPASGVVTVTVLTFSNSSGRGCTTALSAQITTASGATRSTSTVPYLPTFVLAIASMREL